MHNFLKVLHPFTHSNQPHPLTAILPPPLPTPPPPSPSPLPLPPPHPRDQEEDAELDQHNTEYLDELGKTTLESEDSCHNLIAELERRLQESPDVPPLLWRLARAQVHLSMHCEQNGSLEEEKQLLVKG